MQYQINPMIEVNVRKHILQKLHILVEPGYPKRIMIGEEIHDEYVDWKTESVNSQQEIDELMDDLDSWMLGSPYYREVFNY